MPADFKAIVQTGGESGLRYAFCRGGNASNTLMGLLDTAGILWGYGNGSSIYALRPAMWIDFGY